MTTTCRAPASPKPPPAPALDFDARLARTRAGMDDRCILAVLAVDARIPTPDPLPEITAPLRLTPTLVPCPYQTPLAGVLWRACVRLERDGWCTGALRDEQGAACLIGAIRAESATRGQANEACAVLLEAIRRDFPTAETIPSWNDAQRDPRLPARYLGRAASLADARFL